VICHPGRIGKCVGQKWLRVFELKLGEVFGKGE